MPRYYWIAAACVALLLLAFFLWGETPGDITEQPPEKPHGGANPVPETADDNS